MKFYLRSLLRWSGESLDPSCGCFPSSRICDWTCSGAESPHRFPDLWSEGSSGGPDQAEATRTAST